MKRPIASSTESSARHWPLIACRLLARSSFGRCAHQRGAPSATRLKFAGSFTRVSANASRWRGAGVRGACGP